MRAVIISGGKVTDYAYIKTHISATDTIICADNGYNHAVKMGLTPSIVLGDFDSIGDIPDDIPCLQYPTHKDLTDTEIAIEYALSKGFRELLLLAATGNRVDHSLTNILLLRSLLEQGIKAVLIDEYNIVMITDSLLHLHEAPGSIVSLIPLTDCQGVTTNNLEYPLHDAHMRVGTGFGVSNTMLEDKAKVSLKEGVLLVIIAKD